MVMLLLAHTALTPDGKPVAVPMPVASVVACVTSVNAVLIHKAGEEEAAAAVFTDVTAVVIVLEVIAAVRNLELW